MRSSESFNGKLTVILNGKGEKYEIGQIIETEDYVTVTVFFEELPRKIVIELPHVRGKIIDLYVTDSTLVIVVSKKH